MLKNKISGKTLQFQVLDHLPRIKHILPEPSPAIELKKRKV
jgi:hypothetical protein